MKTITLFFLLLFAGLTVNSQNLAEIYKKSQVILEEDPTFGTRNDWKQLLPDIEATRDQGKDGKNKAIVVAPDGTIFMSHHSRHSISMFDADGNYLKEFGQKGGKQSDFVYRPSVIGIMDGKYLVTYAVDGRMLLFDFKGNWVKTVRLDYMPLDNAILKNDKIAILGHTSWTTKYRTFVAIRDIETGKEKIVWDKFTEGIGSNAIVVKYKQGGMSSQSLPYTHSMYTRPKLLTTPDGNLALVFPDSGEIMIYSPEGEKVKTFQVSAGPRLEISQQDREEYYQKALERIKAMEEEKETADEKKKSYLEQTISQTIEQVKKYLDPALYPEKLPTLAQVMFDSDNNLLVFSFTKGKSDNSFFVCSYSQDGKKIAESSFLSDKYDLDFSTSKFQFFKGKIIAVQALNDKNAEVPIRLVRFNLKQ